MLCVIAIFLWIYQLEPARNWNDTGRTFRPQIELANFTTKKNFCDVLWSFAFHFDSMIPLMVNQSCFAYVHPCDLDSKCNKNKVICFWLFVRGKRMICNQKLHVRRDYQLDDVHALRVLTRLYFLTFSTNFPFAEVPEHRPAISGIRIRYRVGDIFRANCTSRNSKPAANLTWSINDHPVSHFNHGYMPACLNTSVTDTQSRPNFIFIHQKILSGYSLGQII